MSTDDVVNKTIVIVIPFELGSGIVHDEHR